jgi:hypothetical protein
VRGVTDAHAKSAYHSSHDDGLKQNKQPDRWTMTKTVMITKMAAAIVLASVAAGLAGSPAQAGWGENGQYGNAPQARPGWGGYGGNGQRPVVVVPGPRPMPPQVVIYPRPAPPPVYVPPQVVVRPVQVPVVVNRPVYVPTPQVVEKTVIVQRPAVVAAPVVAAAPAPVVNNNCNCLVKEYPQAGVVVFRDICTKESATYTNLPQQTSQAVLPPTQ